jgi:hypothetical protein
VAAALATRRRGGVTRSSSTRMLAGASVVEARRLGGGEWRGGAQSREGGWRGGMSRRRGSERGNFWEAASVRPDPLTPALLIFLPTLPLLSDMVYPYPLLPVSSRSF